MRSKENDREKGGQGRERKEVQRNRDKYEPIASEKAILLDEPKVKRTHHNK